MELELPRAPDSHRACYRGFGVEQERPSKELVEATTKFVAANSVDTRFSESEEFDSLQAIKSKCSQASPYPILPLWFEIAVVVLLLAMVVALGGIEVSILKFCSPPR